MPLSVPVHRDYGSGTVHVDQARLEAANFQLISFSSTAAI